jgi:hypothetical protein
MRQEIHKIEASSLAATTENPTKLVRELNMRADFWAGVSKFERMNDANFHF